MAAEAISITGNMITLVAIPWFVLQTTGSAAQTGLAGFFAALPVIVSGPLGGAVVDRLGHRRASMVADLASGATVALIPLLHLTRGIDLWELLALVFLSGLLDVPGGTARTALLPDLVEEAGMRLERATAAVDGVSRGARMLGGPLAGLLIALLGPAQVLFVDAATFLVSALLVWVGVPRPARTSRPESGGYLTELREGFRFVADDRLLRAIVLLVMLTNFLDHGTFAVVVPVYADRVLGGPVDLGLLIGAFGVGALLGTTAYGAVGSRLPRRGLFVAAYLVVGAPRYLLLAAQPGLEVLLVGLVVMGVAAGAINPILLVVEYQRIPRALRGRVFGLTKAVAWGAMPLGALAAGYVVEGLGLQVTLLGAGLVYLLVTLAPAVAPTWREMDRPG